MEQRGAPALGCTNWKDSTSVPNYGYDVPDNFYFGGGGGTFGTPLGIAALLVAIILTLFLQRKYIVVPFLLAGLLVPPWNNLMVAGLNFHADRLLLLAAWVRLLIGGERYPDRLNTLDKVFLAAALTNAICYSLVWRQFGAVVNRAGFLFSALGTYFLLRSLIRDKEDIIRVLKVLAIAVIVLAPLLWYEHMTQHNAFSFLGAPDSVAIRNNRVRATGPFGSAINAGTMGVMLIPLFVGLWWSRPDSRLLAAFGIASSTIMMFASQSSTPVMTFPAAFLGLAMWPFRDKMRMVRRGIIVMLIGLQLVMKVPIWFVLERAGGLFGGSGTHRAFLIDHFIHHFFEWFLIGTRNNVNWGWDMWDVDNAYVGAGVMGGLLGFILFLAIFVYGYKTIGAGWRMAQGSEGDARLIWAFGAALFANTIAFFGIVYFDQSAIAWYALLVMIAVTKDYVARQQIARLQPMAMGVPTSVASGRTLGAFNSHYKPRAQ
jgi:hypothetical protein